MKSLNKIFRILKAATKAEDIKILGFVPTAPLPGWKWAGIFRQYLLCFTSEGIIPFELTSYVFAVFSFFAFVLTGILTVTVFLVTRLMADFPLIKHSFSLFLLWFLFIAAAATAVAYGQKRTEKFTMAQIRVKERSLLKNMETLLRKSARRHIKLSYSDIKELKLDKHYRVSAKMAALPKPWERYDFGVLCYKNTSVKLSSIEDAKNNFVHLAKQVLSEESLIIE